MYIEILVETGKCLVFMLAYICMAAVAFSIKYSIAFVVGTNSEHTTFVGVCIRQNIY